MNDRCSEAFAIECLVQQGWTLSPLLNVIALEPLFHRLRDEKASLALRGIPFASLLSANVSAYASDITVFVSRRLDIKIVKKAVAKNEQIAGPKINFGKREGLLLGDWKVVFPCQGLSTGVTDPSASSGVFRTRPITGPKLVGSTDQSRCPGGYLDLKAVFLKGQDAGVRRVHLLFEPLPLFLTSSA